MADTPRSVPATPEEVGSSPTSLYFKDASPGTPSSSDFASADSASQNPNPNVLGSTSQSSSQSPLDSSLPPRRVPSLWTGSDPQTSATAHMNPTSTLTGTLSSARRPTPSAGNLPLDLMAKARALQQKRMAMSPHLPGSSPGSADQSRGFSPVEGALTGGMPANMRMPPGMYGMNMGMMRPGPPSFRQSAPAVPIAAGRAPGPGPSLSERRAMKLGPLPGGANGALARGPPTLSEIAGSASRPNMKGSHSSRISDFKHYINAEKGWITFEGAATITRTGVNFAGGHTFKISLDEIQVIDELGKGNYGTVYKVRHARPAKPRFGPGLSGFKKSHVPSHDLSPVSPPPSLQQQPLAALAGSAPNNGTTGKVVAMKEIRLELDEAKFTTILKELVILHECVSPYIIDFYGAFYQEGAVYMCIEYMDGGSIDKLYAGGIPEPVLQKITYSTVMGLKYLKDEHNIIHRDVKPTNVLANSRGQVKICDFGVSGNLVASVAKTNIGCQSYMAPERISGGGMAQGGANAEGTYSVQSDIWSLGLTIIECAMGHYPYPPEVSSTIFEQLSAIVHGEPPSMPSNYSATAHDFVKSCLNKNPLKRHTYSMLLKHPWLKQLANEENAIPEAEESEASTEGVDKIGQKVESLCLSTSNTEPPEANSVAGDAEVAAWVTSVLEKKNSEKAGAASSSALPALHAAPLAP